MHATARIQKNPRPATAVVLGLALLIAAAGTGMAGYGPRAVADMLHARGYYNIEITDIDDDEYEVLACKGGTLYEIEVGRDGRIDDIDREGRCGPRHAYSGHHRGEVHVEAPFTGVHVGRDGVHVRAPFVDLHVPRR